MRRLGRRLNGNTSGVGGSDQPGTERPGAWFADPYEVAGERWWDGRRWTDQVRQNTVADPVHGDSPGALNGASAQATIELTHSSPENEASPPATAVAHPPAPTTDGLDDRSVGHDTGPAADLDPNAIADDGEAEDLAADASFVPLANGHSGSTASHHNEFNDDHAATSEVPARLCPHCATLSHTGGEFCPHCGGRYAGGRSGRAVSTRAKVAGTAVIALLVLGGAGAAVTIKLHHDSQVAAQHRRAAAQQLLRQQEQRQQQQQQQQQQQAQQQLQISERQSLETALQTAITKDANDKTNQGLLTSGSVQSTTCTPVSGGSSQNLSGSTGTYSCIAVYQTNSDGTQSGYRYGGTINFDTGSMTWQLGATP